MKTKWLGWVGVALATSLLMAGCGGGGGGSPGSDPSPIDPTGTPTGTLSGYVLSQAGLPLAGVTVRAGEVTVTTAADGSYTLAAVAENERAVVQITLDGYAEAFVVAQVLANQTQEARAARLQLVGATVAIDPAAGGTVSVPDSTAQVVLPAGGLVLANGSTPAGNVSVSLTPINPAKDSALMPGDFTAIPSDSTTPITIESFGALQISARDTNGQSSDLAPGSTATIRIPLGTLSASSPASIPLFWFNAATGRWQQDGSATLVGTGAQAYYQGTVTRLSNWNADKPMQTIFASGCVEDDKQQRVANVRVVSEGVNYSGSGSSRTAADGTFRVPMRRDGVATVRVVNSSGKTLGPVWSVGPSAVDIAVSGCLNIGVAPLEITLAALPSGKVNAAYNVTLAATGGTTAYNWSLSQGTLPAGLSLDGASGQISGTPTVAGWSVFTAQVQDSSNPQQSAYRWFVLWVQAADAPPAAPTGVAAVAGNTQATISWNPVSGATSYNLFMASVAGVTKSNYASLTGGMKHTGVTSPYVHTGLTNGTTYYFVVTALNANGESVESIEVSAAPTAPPVLPPAAPTGVAAVPGNTLVNISWSPVSGATSYNLYMASVAGVTKSNYATLTGGMKHASVTSPYVHTGLTNGATYYFVVTALNANGESVESIEVSATPAAADVYESCLAIKTAVPAAPDGAYVIDPDLSGPMTPMTVRCDMTSNGGGWTQVGNFPWPGNTGGVEGWNSGNAVGTSFTDVTKPFKLSDVAINAIKTVAYRGHGTATMCQTGACTVNTTLYWAASCTYTSSALSANCGNAYTDAALTQRTTTSDATRCSWHWGLVSSSCSPSIAEMSTSHTGDHVFVGVIGTSQHAYDGRAGENPSVEFWVK